MTGSKWTTGLGEIPEPKRGVSQPKDDDFHSDMVAIREVHDMAIALGASAVRAWRAAVGAYLERHPNIDVDTAERMVTALMRPLDDSGAAGAEITPGLRLGVRKRA